MMFIVNNHTGYISEFILKDKPLEEELKQIQTENIHTMVSAENGRRKISLSDETCHISREDLQQYFIFICCVTNRFTSNITALLGTATTGTIDTNNKTIDINDKTIDINDKTIDVNDKTIDINDKTIAINNKFIDINDKTIDLNDKAIDVNDKTLKFGFNMDDIHEFLLKSFTFYI